MSADSIEYPHWYLVHWHFIPGGYLSRRSIAVYDHLIRRFYSAFQEPRINRKLARMLYRKFPDGRLLEIGCGTGRLLEAIDEAGPAAEIVGVDLSPFQLERADARNRMALSPTRVLHADASHLPFEANTFDAAVASHVIGHVPKAVATEILDETQRVVRPGGLLFLYEHRWHKHPIGSWRQLGSTSVRGTTGRIIVLERPR